MISQKCFQSILKPELLDLARIFRKYNYELKIAGGAVRDLLMNIKPHDVDLATNATPTQMIEMFNEEKIRLFNLNGVAHGTVSVRINDRENFEITTLRIDKKTDGRHAEVEFTKDWFIDANRRDLTINAMFLDFDGKLTDYFNGVEDVKNRKVRFVGEPDKRIREDYLRILRYYRFYGRVANNPDDLFNDRVTYEAIKENSNGLAKISGERILDELRKILTQNYVDKIMRLFYDVGLAMHMGLPKDGNLNEFDRVYKCTRGLNPKPMTLLSGALNSVNDLNALNERLRLSNDEKYLGSAIVTYRDSLRPDDNDKTDPLKYYYQELEMKQVNKKITLKQSEVVELLKYQDQAKFLDDLEQYKSKQKYPFQNKFTELEVKLPSEYRLKNMQAVLINKKLQELWIKSNFKSTKDDLLKLLSDQTFLEQFKLERLKKKK